MESESNIICFMTFTYMVGDKFTAARQTGQMIAYIDKMVFYSITF